MDITERKITKIAREAEKLVLLTMREEGVGTAEIDLILHAGSTCGASARGQGRHRAENKKSGNKGLSHPQRCPERPAQSAAVPDRKGGKPEIVQGRDRGGILRVPDKCADGRGDRRLCFVAEQAVYSIQDGKPRRISAFQKSRRR